MAALSPYLVRRCIIFSNLLRFFGVYIRCCAHQTTRVTLCQWKSFFFFMRGKAKNSVIYIDVPWKLKDRTALTQRTQQSWWIESSPPKDRKKKDRWCSVYSFNFIYFKYTLLRSFTCSKNLQVLYMLGYSCTSGILWNVLILKRNVCKIAQSERC